MAERDAAATALEAQLAAANERADAAEDALEEARLEVAELKRVSDVQVRRSCTFWGWGWD